MESAAVRVDLEGVLQEFDDAWQGPQPPAIRDFVSSLAHRKTHFNQSEWRELVEEVVRADIGHRWGGAGVAATALENGAGAQSTFPRHPLLEDYILELRGVADLDVMSPDLIGEEYWVRHKHGDAPKHAEYLKRFPERADEVERQLCLIDGLLRRERRGRGSNRGSTLTCPGCRQPLPTAVNETSVVCPSCGSTVRIDSESVQDGSPPMRAGRYEFRSLIGSGAFGAVWRAWDTELSREVAVKVPRRGQFENANAFFVKPARRPNSVIPESWASTTSAETVTPSTWSQIWCRESVWRSGFANTCRRSDKPRNGLPILRRQWIMLISTESSTVT